jgi:hypothetical protein
MGSDISANIIIAEKKQSSGMWRCADIVLTDVSEERIASIFRVEERRRKSASKESA